MCFLYHLLGNGTGEWDVPIGGMGAVSGALAAAAARAHGAEITTGADVYAIDPDGVVHYRATDDEHVAHGRFVLSEVTPTVLAGLLGDDAPECAPGAQVKVNLMLSRLPRLRDDAVTRRAGLRRNVSRQRVTHPTRLRLRRGAAAASIPDPLPCEIYCHSLTDPTILSDELRRSGAQTFTVFGLHTPHRAVCGRPGVRRATALTDAVLASLNSVLAEPIQDVLMTDAHGRPCIETKTTADLERL